MIVFFASLILAKAEIDTSVIERKCGEGVFTVLTNVSQGTGFLINDREALTCAHCVGAISTYVTLRAKTGHEVGAIVEYRSESLDLAVVRAERSLSSDPLYISSSSARQVVGAEVVVIGTPAGYDHTLNKGIISGKRLRLGDNFTQLQLLQLQVPLSHGSSGSPVLDKDANVIGMVQEKDTNGEELNFALSSLTIDTQCSQWQLKLVKLILTSPKGNVDKWIDTNYPTQTDIKEIVKFDHQISNTHSTFSLTRDSSRPINQNPFADDMPSPHGGKKTRSNKKKLVKRGHRTK